MAFEFREFDWDEISRKDTFVKSKKIEKQLKIEGVQNNLLILKEELKYCKTFVKVKQKELKEAEKEYNKIEKQLEQCTIKLDKLKQK